MARRVTSATRDGEVERRRRPRLGDAPLSAPLEAHLQLTNRCDAGCQGCYTGATPNGAPASGARRSGSARSTRSPTRGVFHLALGGGESAVLPWLGELAEHARGEGSCPT